MTYFLTCGLQYQICAKLVVVRFDSIRREILENHRQCGYSWKDMEG